MQKEFKNLRTIKEMFPFLWTKEEKIRSLFLISFGQRKVLNDWLSSVVCNIASLISFEKYDGAAYSGPIRTMIQMKRSSQVPPPFLGASLSERVAFYLCCIFQQVKKGTAYVDKSYIDEKN